MELRLSDGYRVAGEPLGAMVPVTGEVVFHTGMAGYEETLTDPSFRGQILVLGFPAIGNHGVAPGPWESARIQVRGLVLGQAATAPQAGSRSLADWLRAEGVPALAGVQTRALVRHLRASGPLRGRLGPPDAAPVATEPDDSLALARAAAIGEIRKDGGPGPRVLLVDLGAKESLVRALRARGAAVVRAPFHARWEALVAQVDGLVLSNGPGDPAAFGDVVARLRPLLAGRRPILGVCLGHQLLALAAGADVERLPVGHRSHNQPVCDLVSGRALVTSQNHGFAVRPASLARDWAARFVNMVDGSNEGIHHRAWPHMGVQFHPEAAGGPRDGAYVLDEFLAAVRAARPERA